MMLAACGRMLPDAPPVSRYPYLPRTEAPLVGSLINRPISSGTQAAVVREGSALGQCVAELTAARVTFNPVPNRRNSAHCGLTNGGILGPDFGTVARLQPGDPDMTCQLALALSVWRRQSLEPAAREILGSDVVQIDHFGTYACRNVNNGAGSTRISSHASAAAFDFAGVRLRDGRRISVKGQWGGNSPEARFLRRIRDDACKVFGTTLSPDFNAVHHDHLHLEATDTRYCR